MDRIIGPHFYGQPADDIFFSVIFLVGHSMDLSTVSDCAVYVNFDCLLVACLHTSLSHCFYRVRDIAFSYFPSFDDDCVAFVHWWVGWVTGWFLFFVSC